MMCIPSISFLSSLSTVHLIVLSIKHDMRRGIIGNERRGDGGALHAEVTGRAKGREVGSVFSLCGFCQAEFCLARSVLLTALRILLILILNWFLQLQIQEEKYSY